MRQVILLLGLAFAALAQQSADIVAPIAQPLGGVLTKNSLADINQNFRYMKTRWFNGNGAPGVIEGSSIGSMYLDTSGTSNVYVCFNAVQCTAVAAGNWVLLGSGTGPTTLSWVSLSSGQWASLTSSQWAALTP